jgi:hypothetical protein
MQWPKKKDKPNQTMVYKSLHKIQWENRRNRQNRHPSIFVHDKYDHYDYKVCCRNWQNT